MNIVYNYELNLKNTKIQITSQKYAEKVLKYRLSNKFFNCDQFKNYPSNCITHQLKVFLK